MPQWLADPATPPRLKDRLELSQRIRDFAVAELGEPDNASYRRYADLQRGRPRCGTSSPRPSSRWS